MKKWIALLCVVLLVAALGFLPKPTQADAGKEPVDKRSEALKLRMETMTEDETVNVYIWFADIDLGDVEAEAERRVGFTQKDIDALGDSMPFFPSEIRETDPNYEELYWAWRESTQDARERTLKMQNDLYAAQNDIMREAYEAYNQSNLEIIDLAPEELWYASIFSPMILAHLTIDGINRLQKIEEVLWLDYSEPQHWEPELDVAIPTVDADYVRDTEGYDGQGVVIGMIDGGNIDTDHDELSNANITFLNNNHTISIQPHSTQVARILVGSNGVAPNAQLIATSYNAYSSPQECIEEVLDHNVSVINMSFGDTNNRNSYLTRLSSGSITLRNNIM
ncbi:MAG: S8 family serine peptidase [Clostridia bacterium]|nr:S8 family serine peptidase [Clostridia bacterium]